MLQNHVVSYCISGERAPSVDRPAKPGGEVFRYVGFCFFFVVFVFLSVLVLVQDEIWVVRWGD